ncbi:hypothetical protein HanPSC8_Chr17g0747181 [Helianthus annuus]|nr:hypothetical protein HanPSC8_Chr17g0747181 [Helianthus annuus]
MLNIHIASLTVVEVDFVPACKTCHGFPALESQNQEPSAPSAFLAHLYPVCTTLIRYKD